MEIKFKACAVFCSAIRKPDLGNAFGPIEGIFGAFAIAEDGHLHPFVREHDLLKLLDPADPAAVEELFVDVPDIYFSNLNGMETLPGTSDLVVVHNEAGALYRVDPATGEAAVLYGPPNDPPFLGADGMSRVGRTLYVVENGASRISCSPNLSGFDPAPARPFLL